MRFRARSHRIKAADNRHAVNWDSAEELARYEYLLIRWRAGEITEPKIHEHFQIVVNGIDCGYYEADFTYHEIRGGQIGRLVVEDVKGSFHKKKQSKRKGVVVREWKEKAPILTEVYLLKKKIVEALHEITIKEIWQR